jgi:energy-coupling factor transporter ATP-binding protein EcfA2
MVSITNPETNEIWDYHIEPKLIPYLDEVKKNVDKKDRDFVILVDGYEGSGKSTFAQQIGRYLDNSLNLDRICMTADEFKQAIINAKKGDCIIYDEAVMGLSSGESITRIGRILKSMMMQMRQKNLYVIIIIPAFFELNKYAVLGRAKGLFHIYEKNGKRGYFVGYNKADMKKIYLMGRKNYSYCWRSYFNGKFYGKFAVDEMQYRKKKEDALFGLDEEPEEENRMTKQRNALLLLLKDKGVTQKSIVATAAKVGVRISEGQLSKVFGKMPVLT